MPNATAFNMLDAILTALDLPADGANRVTFVGNDRWPSCFPVSDLAVASIGAAAMMVSELPGLSTSPLPVSVSYRLSSLWFGWSIKPQDWEIPNPWDAIAGDYRANDGWIKLHTNAPNHRAVALSVLGCEPTRDAVSDVVALWRADELEDAIVAAGGCASRLQTSGEWLLHPQGIAVSGEPLIQWDTKIASSADRWQPSAHRPLAGLRVLDLTRIIAGPVATRFLAGFGADVLRIDPPGWDEPAVAPEVTLGKRCARLDLKSPADRDVFRALLSEADILIHGYRSDALDGMGFDSDARQAIRPGLIDISLNAYGHSGPWQRRRGFDSLVQFSSGIAAAGMDWRSAGSPVSLPVQALDHATGYLMAAAAIRGLIARANGSGLARARLSLARTAKLLSDHRATPIETEVLPAKGEEFSAVLEQSDWGPAQRLLPPAELGDIKMAWPQFTARLGTSAAAWSSRN